MRKRYSRSYTVLSFLTMFSYREQPFRAAYKIAGQLVAYCIEHTAVLEELPLALLRQYSERFGEDVYAAIALTSCVTGRTSLGGTCVASVEAQIASVRDFLAGQTEAAKQAENG